MDRVARLLCCVMALGMFAACGPAEDDEEPLVVVTTDNNGANNGGGSDAGNGNDGGSDAGGNNANNGGSDGGSDAGGDTGGDEEDMSQMPAAPEVDPMCIDGQYSETLPDPNADVSAEVAAYSSNDVETFIYGVLDERYPVGSWVVAGGMTNQQFDCIDQFLRDTSNAQAVMNGLSTVVHECGHAYDFTLGGFSDDGYGITPQLTITCSGGDTTSRGGSTFARSRLLNDSYQDERPPCDGQFGQGCDGYADTYLDGDPDNGSFEGGDQGFNSVLEETLQYVNSLATDYAFQDQINGATSALDGILTFLWYVERYLRMARLDYPDAYQKLSQDACWREAILTIWGRAWLMLEVAEGNPRLGIDDQQLFELVRDPDLLGEIERLRDAEGCP